MITTEQITAAKQHHHYTTGEPHHEHEDCIRMAYEWLDAQRTIKTGKNYTALKHIIQEWCGRYISASDVEIAAYLHPNIDGDYPSFNLSSMLTRPNVKRITNIEEAFTHEYHKSPRYADEYSTQENLFAGELISVNRQCKTCVHGLACGDCKNLTPIRRTTSKGVNGPCHEYQGRTKPVCFLCRDYIGMGQYCWALMRIRKELDLKGNKIPKTAFKLRSIAGCCSHFELREEFRI